MKTKLLVAFLSIAFFPTSYSQQEASSYVANLNEPSGIVHFAHFLYVQGPKHLSYISTATTNPNAVLMYTPTTNYYMTNIAIEGDMLYVSEEIYDEELDESLGSRILSFDLNSSGESLPPTIIYTTTGYISSLAVKNYIVYFTSETTPDANDNFTVQLNRLDSTLAPPVNTVAVSNLTENEEANDMNFYGNDLLISVGGDAKIYSYDITSGASTATELLTGLTFNKGLFVSGNALFTAEGNSIKKRLLDAISNQTSVALNTTYQDSNNGIPFNANFRDVVLIGDKLYMTLQDQGRVMVVQDATLSAGEFGTDVKGVSIYNSKTDLKVTGLGNSQTANVYNLSGQLLLTKEVSANENAMDISSFSEGVYLLTLDNQMTFKFIK